MAHLQYLPGDPRLVDQLVCELKSKGIFDQFRKDCIADVDTKPAYQNLRQRVESSVSIFLSRQAWKPDLNKNQLREKLRKHILDGNFLEQGVERIVDQVVNPKVASVFIPQVEDLVYNYLGITRKKTVNETSNDKTEKEKTDLLPTDLEAVSPGSVKSNEDKDEPMETDEIMKDDSRMDTYDEDTEVKEDTKHKDSDKPKDESKDLEEKNKSPQEDVVVETRNIPLPADMKLEDIPLPDNSPPTVESKEIDIKKIQLPPELDLQSIPMPVEPSEDDKNYFKPINTDDDDDSSSDSSLRRNMSPLTPIRNFNNENSCDAQQGFDNDLADNKDEVKTEPSSFRFTIENKSSENSVEEPKLEVKNEDSQQTALTQQFNNQVTINSFDTPMYEDSSNSNNLQIDYESDANSKINVEPKIESDQNSEDKKEKHTDKKSSSHKSSHRSRDSHRHSSSSKDRSSKRSDSKTSSSKDHRDSKHDKKSSKDDNKSKIHEKSKDGSDKKESKQSSRHSSSHRSSSRKDSKSHHSSSSSHKSSRAPDEKKSSSSSSRDKSKSERSSDRDKNSKEHKSSKDSKSHRSNGVKDRKSSSSSKSKADEKDKEKKEKKEADDHYRLSGRGSNSRRSTDRDSNDGSSSSKGSHNNPSSTKSSDSKKDKSSSKTETTSNSSDSTTSPSDKEITCSMSKTASLLQAKPVVRVDTHLETPIASTGLGFVPDVTLKKPKFAANMEEAKKMMKMRKFLEDEQRRMNQEAALLLEFQANVRPSLSQVYSSIPGPELEFACVTSVTNQRETETIENIQNHIIENENTELVKDYNIKPTDYDKELSNEQTENLKEMLSEVIHTETNSTENLSATMTKIVTESNKDETKQTQINIDACKKGFKDDSSNDCNKVKVQGTTVEEVYEHPEEKALLFFSEKEKSGAEIEVDKFNRFFSTFSKKTNSNKLFLINCGSYEENIFKQISEEFCFSDVVNYHKNGHLKPNNLVKNVNISDEITLPIDGAGSYNNRVQPPMFSPVKSECSFELSSEYDAKLEEMVNNASRQDIMEIIIGSIMPDASPSKMPKIDYFMESNIEFDTDNTLKRKVSDLECLENNNKQIFGVNKIRKMSSSDQITSTTEESDQRPKAVNSSRSKYLGRAKRIGLSRPKKINLSNSPSSDKSVENYEQNSQPPVTPNGKIKQRNKVQRYDTSDLYKPKLHFLSRRNNIESEN